MAKFVILGEEEFEGAINLDQVTHVEPRSSGILVYLTATSEGGKSRYLPLTGDKAATVLRAIGAGSHAASIAAKKPKSSRARSTR